jgi:hypothetical protein
MSSQVMIAIIAAFLMTAVYSPQASAAGAGPPYPPTPDPCGPNGCPKPRKPTCHTTHSHVCVEWQGNPPHCRRYEDQERTVCL